MCPVQRTGTNKRRRLLSLLKPGSPSFETRRAVYRNFTYRFTGFVREATLFEQLKAAPRRGQAPTRRPACCGYWEQGRFAKKRDGEQFRGASALHLRLAPHVSEAFCAAVTALRSRCNARGCQALPGSPVPRPPSPPPPLKSSIQKLQPENDLRVVAESVSMSPVVWKRHNATGL